MTYNDLKIGDKVYDFDADIDIRVRMSVPYMIVEINKDHMIGFNPEAEMTTWIDEDLFEYGDYSFTPFPDTRLMWDFDLSKDEVLDSYKTYIKEKYDRDIEEQER